MRWLWLVITIGSAFACTEVRGDRITGRDLARADSRFAAVPAEFAAGFSAAPGMRRVVSVRELARIAKLHGIEAEGVSPLCFEQAAEAISADRIKSALVAGLPPGSRIEIVDFSRFRAPKGELTFAIADLSLPPEADRDAAVIWRGKLAYGTRRSMTVWVRVKVAVQETWVETAAAVRAREVIAPEQVVMKTGWRFPFATAPVRDAGQAAGNTAVRSLRAGQIVYPHMLAPARDVKAGDTVEVEVASGGVRLRMSGTAMTGGNSDDSIVVSLSGQGRNVKGRVQGKGRVLIDAGKRAGVRDGAAAGGGDAHRQGEPTAAADFVARRVSR